MLNKYVLCSIYGRNLRIGDMLMVLVVGSPVGFVLLIQRLSVLQKPFEGISHTSLFLIAFSDANCRSIYLSQYYIVTDLFSRTAINEMLPPGTVCSFYRRLISKYFILVLEFRFRVVRVVF